MPKKKAPEAMRKTLAARVQTVIDRKYGTLHGFAEKYPKLSGRVTTWVLPQRRSRPTKADYAALVMPDGAALGAFCTATKVSADWLLGFGGDDDTPVYHDQTRSEGALEADVAEHVLSRVNEVAASPWLYLDGAALLTRLVTKGVEEAQTLAKWKRETSLWLALSQGRAYAQRQPTPGSFGDMYLLGDAVKLALEAGAPDRPDTLVLD